jgi:hypothetical protein
VLAVLEELLEGFLGLGVEGKVPILSVLAVDENPPLLHPMLTQVRRCDVEGMLLCQAQKVVDLSGVDLAVIFDRLLSPSSQDRHSSVRLAASGRSSASFSMLGP